MLGPKLCRKYIVSMQFKAQHPVYISMPSINSISKKVKCNSLLVLVHQHQSVPNMTKITGGESPTNTHAVLGRYGQLTDLVMWSSNSKQRGKLPYQ